MNRTAVCLFVEEGTSIIIIIIIIIIINFKFILAY